MDRALTSVELHTRFDSFFEIKTTEADNEEAID